MKKMKLNIQMFASTNKTTNYELPQFIGTDKPSWLGDINSAMSTIDGGMHDNATAITGIESTVQTASATATQASQDVATLTETVTTQGGSITSIDGRVTSLETDNATNKANITNVTGRVSTLESDNIVNKQNITANSNRIEDVEKYLSLTDNRQLNAYSVTNGGSVGFTNLSVALNNTGTFGKVYGYIEVNNATGNTARVKYTNTGIKGVTSEFTINTVGIVIGGTNSGVGYVNLKVIPPTGNQTSASVEVRATASNNTVSHIVIFPCCYIFKNFGDVE